MAASRVNINITAKDNASKVLRDVARELERVQKETESLSTRVKSAGQSMMKFGAGLTAGVTTPILLGFRGMVQAAEESRKVMAVTEQIIKSTGGAANMTAKDIDALATSLSDKTGIDDEAIVKSQQVLLTFSKIRNEVGQGNDMFTRASKAMLDMGTVFGSADAAAMQLGKALQDPLKGIGALSRAGVTFDKQQKAQIKTLVASGKTLEAQKIIMAEVEKQVGGTAEANATAMDKMRVAVDNTKESLGTILLPVVDMVAQKVSALAQRFQDLTPSAQKAVVIGLALAAAMGPLVTIIGGIVTAVGFLLSPIGLVVALIAALVAAAIYAYRHFDGFREVVDRLAATVRDALPKALEFLRNAWSSAVELMRTAWARWGDDVIAAAKRAMDWFQREVVPTIQAVGGYIKSALAAIARFWAEHGDTIIGYLKGAFSTIASIVRPALEFIGNVITAVLRIIRGDWSGAWDAIKAATGNAIDLIKTIVGKLGQGLKALMKLAWELAKKAFDAGVDLVVEAAKKIPGLILDGLGKLGDLLLEAGKDIVRGLIKGIKDMAGSAGDAIKDLVGKLPGIGKKILGIKSPSRVFAEIGNDIVRGLVVGIEDEQNTALRAVSDLADKVVAAFTASVDAVRGAYSAFKSTRTATEGLAEAQESLNELRVKASTIDQRIADAERRVGDAKAAGEDGAKDLRDAEAELADLRKEKLSLPKDMADATRRLSDAQDGLTDATLAQFEAARRLAEQGPRAIDVFAQYAAQAGVAAAEIDKITTAARLLAASIDGIPSFKTVAVNVVQTVLTPQYDPGSQIPVSDAGINSGRRVENGVEYVWVEGIGWVRKSGGQVHTGARASGGPVSAGGAYVVGENGPELFRPARSGTIVPNGGGTTIVVNVAGSVLSERDLTSAVVDGLRRSGAIRPDGTVKVAR